MVGQGEPPIDETEEEIAQEAKVEIARAARLAREAEKEAEKRHASQDSSRDLDEKARDGVTSGGHHPKFNRRHPVGPE
jgi:hypothetical protein